MNGITKEHGKTLREILACWNALSNLKEGEPGFAYMTDHQHALFGAGEELAEKLEEIPESSAVVRVVPLGEWAKYRTLETYSKMLVDAVTARMAAGSEADDAMIWAMFHAHGKAKDALEALKI